MVAITQHILSYLVYATFLLSVLIAALPFGVKSEERPAQPELPNILLILVDDLGWRDLSCYGNSLHSTLSIDRLAKEGMRFTNAYAAAPICSASRAALLTVKTPARLGFEFVTKTNAEPPKTLRRPVCAFVSADPVSC